MFVNRNFKLPIFWQCDIHIVGRSIVSNRTRIIIPLSTNYFNFGSVIIEYWYLIFTKLLIFRLLHFTFGSEIQPQLKPNRFLSCRPWHLSMHNSFACSHPLNITRSDSSFMTFKIFMMHHTRLHICNCLESTMRMVWKSSR